MLKLESVEDVISLGSSWTHLARTIGQKRIWKVIFSKTELVEGGRVREDRVRVITTFLSSLANSDSLFCLLHRMIYKHYPSTVQGWEEASTVKYTDTGLELLALTDREDARHMLHKVRVSGDLPLPPALPGLPQEGADDGAGGGGRHLYDRGGGEGHGLPLGNVPHLDGGLPTLNEQRGGQHPVVSHKSVFGNQEIREVEL